MTKSRARSDAGPFRRETPLVPAVTTAGRALVTVIAIMTFLAGLSAGVAFLTLDASRDWRGSLAQEVTVQIRPVAGRNIEADIAEAVKALRNVQGVIAVEPMPRAQSERLLEPWLGAGLDLRELPVPRIVTVRLETAARSEIATLRKALVAAVPVATIDDHQVWMQHLTTMANALVAVALAVFGLVVFAMALAVAFATRGAVAGNKEIVDVLHLVGAEDRFIAREFQRNFFRLGLRGAAAGGALALLTFAAGGLLTRAWVSSAASDQLELLFGAFALGWKGYAAIVLVAFGVSLLTGIVSRSIVFRRLRGLD